MLMKPLWRLREKSPFHYPALRHFPRKKKAAVPVKARKYPLTLSGLQKMGPGVPVPACTFAPQASGTPSSDREDSRLYRTIFILWGVEPVCMTLLVTMDRLQRGRTGIIGDDV